MSALERGMVDPQRSYWWNLVRYRRGRETRVWSPGHSEMHRKIMMTHDVIILAALFFAVGLIGGLTRLMVG